MEIIIKKKGISIRLFDKYIKVYNISKSLVGKGICTCCSFQCVHIAGKNLKRFSIQTARILSRRGWKGPDIDNFVCNHPSAGNK